MGAVKNTKKNKGFLLGRKRSEWQLTIQNICSSRFVDTYPIQFLKRIWSLLHLSNNLLQSGALQLCWIKNTNIDKISCQPQFIILTFWNSFFTLQICLTDLSYWIWTCFHIWKLFVFYFPRFKGLYKIDVFFFNIGGRHCRGSENLHFLNLQIY